MKYLVFILSVALVGCGIGNDASTYETMEEACEALKAMPDERESDEHGQAKGFQIVHSSSVIAYGSRSGADAKGIGVLYVPDTKSNPIVVTPADCDEVNKNTAVGINTRTDVQKAKKDPWPNPPPTAYGTNDDRLRG